MRPIRTATLHLALILAVGVPAWAAPPEKAGTTQASSDKASELMNQGVAHYSKGNLEGARKAFLEAFELAPHHTVASNLAEVEIKLGRYRDASEHLNYVLRALPPSATEERMSSEKDLAQCRERLSVVRVAVTVQGAAVTLDGKTLGTAPLETELWLEPGEYVVEARHVGYEPASERVVAKAGESREITLALGQLQAAVGTENILDDARRDDGKTESSIEPKTVVLVGGGVLTLAAATVGTIFILKSGSAADDADKARAEIAREEPDLAAEGRACLLEPAVRPKACATLTGSQKDQANFQSIALGSFIAAGALGAGTVATYLLWPEKKAADESTRWTTRPRLSVLPWIGPKASGITAELLFP